MSIKNCVWFNSEDIFNELVSYSHMDVAFKLKLETFKDRYQYKMYIEDMQTPRFEENQNEKYFSLYNTVFPLETVIYTRKKLDGSELKLVYHEDEVDVTLNRNYLTTLDPQTSYLLINLKKNYNYNFKVVIKDIIMKEENYNVHLIIDRDWEFTSYSIKQGELFKDIKDFLIGDFNYNSLQKNILASIFKEKKNTLLIAEKGRGIDTVILTIALFYKNIEEKVLYISDSIPKKKILNHLDISNSFIEGYSFYIVDKKIDYSPLYNKRALIISHNDIEVKGFKKIVDSYTLPDNLVFMEDNLTSKKDIFSHFLPIDLRRKILKNLNLYPVIFTNKDILVHL